MKKERNERRKERKSDIFQVNKKATHRSEKKHNYFDSTE